MDGTHRKNKMIPQCRLNTSAAQLLVSNFHSFNPLTAGFAYIWVFIFY